MHFLSSILANNSIFPYFRDNDSTPTTWLVTGANRGIGFGLVTHLLNRPNTIVFATARNPAIAHDLNKLSKRFPDRLHVLKFEVTSRDEGLAAAEQVKQIVGTNGLDVVIANAGVSLGLGPIATTSPQSFIDNFKVNTLGPLNTFQVFYPLLKIGKQKKFFVISSTIGSVTEIARFAEIADMPYEAYGASKAAVNHLARKMYYEHRDEGFIICPFCPGHVATDMVSIKHLQSEFVRQDHNFWFVVLG